MNSFPGWKMAIKYARYYAGASNGKGHGTHSPFVYDFIRTVLNDRTAYPDYKKVEALRQKLLDDQTVLNIQDLGAGRGDRKSRIGEIAARSAKPKKYGQLLFRIARRYDPENILELGTSLGISTAYFSFGAPEAGIDTIEGSAMIAEQAEANFKKLGLQKIRVHQGHFNTVLPKLLHGGFHPDLAFIDGNHEEKATLDYFHQLKKVMDDHSMMIFDDIHWSKGMENAWKAIKNDPQVTATIDLFFIGIVLFRKEFYERQHFVVRF